MSLSLPLRTSEAEFLSWPASTTRVELIDGDVVRAPAPSYRHQDILRRILHALGTWSESRPVTIGQSPCDVRFGPARILQPDAFVILQRIDPFTRGPITVIPSLCIEVLSDDAPYDRITKRLIYAGAGVEELWTVHADGYVERWTGPGLVNVETITDRLTTPLLPGFELRVEALFERP